MPKEAARYAVYIVRCADDTLYTGFTTDVRKRVETHNSGKAAAKYTKIRRPVSLLRVEYFEDKSSALKREWEIKKMTRAQKNALIQNGA